MAYAQPSDIEAQLGRSASSATETTQWQAWLDVVERRIVRAFTRAGLVLDDQLDLDDPTLDDLIDVEVEVVLRKIQNPEWGVTSTTRSVDDASVTKRREGTSVLDPLALTRDDLTALLPSANVRRARAFSVLPS